MSSTLLAARRLATASTASMTATTGRLALAPTQTRGYRQVRPPTGGAIPSPTARHEEIPPYPLGPRRTYKQANTGLYGSATIQFGNTVSRETEVINSQKNRRRWWPNVQHKRLWSASLGAMVRTRVSMRVLRTIDKVGGLDAYLLGSKAARIRELGPWGWRLRWRIMQTDAVQAQFRAQRVALGLPVDGLYEQARAAEPEGQVSADVAPEEADASAYAATTQAMIDSEAEFDLAPQEGFMAEKR